MPRQDIRELRAALNTCVNGTPEELSPSTPEYQTVNHLCGIMSGFEISDYSYDRVVTEFALKAKQIPGFDVVRWIGSKVAEGVYDLHDDPEQ